MKTLTLLLTAVMMLPLFANAQRVNEKVQIESNGAWYDGKILKVEGNKYFVTYEGWSDSWDEWVGIERLKGYAAASAPVAPGVTGKFKVGDRVEVEYGMVPEPATIIEVGENKYHIKYDNSLFKSKWVTEGQIKKL